MPNPFSSGQVETLTLSAGKTITLQVDAGPGVTVERWSGGSPISEPAVTSTATYGPYLSDMQFRFSAMFGTIARIVQTAQGLQVPQTAQRATDVKAAALDAAVSGGGIGPVSTFANLPAASANAGNSYRVSDVGPVGAGSIWISDGTRWRTLGGRQLHCAAQGTIAAPLATLAGATGKFVLPTGDRVSSGAILLPVGLPQVGQGLQVSCKVRHRGTGGAWNFVARIGTGDAATDSSFAQVAGTATDDQGGWVEQDLEVVTATSFVASTFAVPNQAGAGAVVLRNSNFNNAAQLYLGFYSSTLNAADFVDLISYRVYLLG